MLVRQKPGIVFPFIAMCLHGAICVSHSYGQAGNDRTAILELEKESEAAKIADQIDLAWARHGAEAVSAIVQQLDDKRVISVGDGIDPLRVCDYAAARLESFLGINVQNPGFYFLRPHKVRDIGIKAWKDWWKTNRQKSPMLWFDEYVDPLFASLHADMTRRELSITLDVIGESAGLKIGVLGYKGLATRDRKLKKLCEASILLVKRWWARNKTSGRKQCLKSAGNMNLILRPAHKYKSFVVENNLEGELNVALTKKRLHKNDLKECGVLIENFKNMSQKDKLDAASKIREMLGTDFGYMAFVRNPKLKKEQAASEKVMQEWWAFSHQKSPKELADEVHAGQRPIAQANQLNVCGTLCRSDSADPNLRPRLFLVISDPAPGPLASTSPGPASADAALKGSMPILPRHSRRSGG